MNFLADEGVDRQIVERLRIEGYSVLYVAQMQPGISDDVVLDLANQYNALLITADKDFGEHCISPSALNRRCHIATASWAIAT